MRQLLQRLPRGFTVVCEDESIFIHDAVVKKVWAEKGRRPVCIVTGSHQRTCVFGAMSIEGKQISSSDSTTSSTKILSSTT